MLSQVEQEEMVERGSLRLSGGDQGHRQTSRFLFPPTQNALLAMPLPCRNIFHSQLLRNGITSTHAVEQGIVDHPPRPGP